MANDPQRLRCALHGARGLLKSPAGLQLDGWGIGFYQGGEVLLQRRPKPTSEAIDLYDQLREVRTDALIMHLRKATFGDAKNENTHPFRFRSWLFAHHGSVVGYPETREALLGPVPSFLRRNIRGQTDSEDLFHVFLANLHATNKMDDPMVPPSVVSRALVDALLHTERVASGSVLDVAVTNGRILLVSRRGAPLYMSQVNGVKECAVCREAPQELGHFRSSDHEHLRAVALVAAPGTDKVTGPWHEVPDGHIVTVSHELRVETTPIA
jgi:glutamine amidotransferase